MTVSREDRTVAELLSVHAAIEMGAGIDVAMEAVFAPHQLKAVDKAAAAMRMELEPARWPAVASVAVTEHLGPLAGDYLGVAIALLLELERTTGRPATDLLSEALNDEGDDD